MKLFALVFALVLLASPCLAQTLTLNATEHCPGFTEGINIHLSQGTYHIEYVSGAWSPIPDDAIYGGYAWSSRVHFYVYTTGEAGVIGPPANPGYYQSPELAEAAAKGIYVLTIPRNTIVSFWLDELVNPINDCSDNRGSVTLRFVSPLATMPTTWGRIKSLYRLPIR